MINDWVIIYCGKALGHLTSFRYEVQERAEMQLCHAIGTYTTGDTLTSTLIKHLHILLILDEKSPFLGCPFHLYSMEVGSHFQRIS